MLTLSDSSTFSDVPLFAGLSPEEVSRFAGMLRRKVFPAGSNIFAEDQPGEAVYILVNGTVKVHVAEVDGREVILAILGAGEVLGEMSVLDSMGRSASALTMEETTTLWMDRTSFWDYLRSTPGAAFNLLRILSRRLRMTNSHLRSLAALDVYGRIARQIMSFAREYGKPDENGAIVIPLHLRQADLGDLVGASRQRVNQVLSFYRQQNYISLDHAAHITVLDPEALERRCW